MKINNTHSNKRAIAPLIATVLLIAITIAAALAVFVFAKGFVKENVEKLGGPIETACQGISFDALLTGKSIQATNKGNVVIYAFNVKFETAGTSKLKFIKTDSGKLGIGEVDKMDISGLTGDTITLIPVLLGKGVNSGTGKLYPCNENAVVVSG